MTTNMSYIYMEVTNEKIFNNYYHAYELPFIIANKSYH